jgi:hypothetical protein
MTEQILRQQRRQLEFFELTSLQRLTGLDPKEDLLEFLVKESFDNCLDKSNTQNIIVSLNRHRDHVELLIRDDGSETFSEEDIRTKLLDFDKSVSSKRGRKVVSRGILGNALQLSIGLSSVAWKGLRCPSDCTVKITSAGTTYSISARRNADDIQTRIVTKKDRPSKFTSVSFILPLFVWDQVDWIEGIIDSMSWVNPHVTFSLKVSDRPVLTRNRISDHDPLEKSKSGECLGNIYCYSQDEFERVAEEYSKQGVALLSFVSQFDNFKTESNAERLIKKARITSLSREAHDKLYSVMKKESRQPSEREIPCLGQDHFKQILAEKFVRYKRISGLYKDSESLIPWAIELVSFKEEDERPFVYEFVNFSYAGSKRPLTVWDYQDRDKIFDITSAVEKSGLSLMIHAISSSWKFDDQGKGQLDVAIFKEKIPRAVKSVLKHSVSGAITQLRVLRQILLERVLEVQNDPSIIKRNKWTQSTVFYLARKNSPIPLNRKSFTAAIRAECEKLGFKRHELGIKAADRAQLYFRGSVHDVGLEELEDLAKLGTDIIFIEKEGACEVLSPVNHEGIALLNSRGFAVEYATELMQLAQTKRCNLAMLTDLDASGLLMAEKLSGIPRIGISIDTLVQLGLRRQSVEETYKPPRNHLDGLRKSDLVFRQGAELFSYIQSKRIEIDSVLAEVSPETFWQYLLHELRRIYPSRDYTRAINVDPSGIAQRKYLPVIKPLVDRSVSVTKQLTNKFNDSKRNVDGFLDIEKVESEFEHSFHERIKRDRPLRLAEAKLHRILNFQYMD